VKPGDRNRHVSLWRAIRLGGSWPGAAGGWLERGHARFEGVVGIHLQAIDVESMVRGIVEKADLLPRPRID